MHIVWQDIRYGARMLRSNAGFTAAAVVCMALGIGATTAIFSVVDAVLLKPLPYRNPERLVRLYTEFPTFPKGGLRRFWTSLPEYDELKRGLKSWDALEAWTVAGANLSGGGTSEPIRVPVTNVTGVVLVAAGAESIPRSGEVHLNAIVLLVTFSVAVVTGIFFGVAPVMPLSLGNVYGSLKSASRRTTSSIHSQYFRSGLVVMQLSMALVLLIGNGLMIRAFWKLLSVNAGFNPDRVLTLQIPLPPATYPDSKATTQFWTSLEDRVRSLPGVDNAATVAGLPPLRPINANDTQIEGFVPKPGGPIQNIDYWQFVGPRYFDSMGIRLVEGRTFDGRDGAGSPPVVVINRTMAQIYWPGESPLGRRVRPPGGPGVETPWFTIVGVVDDVKNAGIDKPAGTELYFAVPQLTGGPFALRAAFLVVKTKSDPMSIVGAIRSEVRSLDSSLPVANVRTMDDIMATSQSRPRFLALLLSVFSATAMILAAVGIYGVISYSVAQRTSEFGIRMALGANRHRVLIRVLSRGVLMATIGMILGIVGAFALTRFLRELLFEVNTLDPSTFATMALLLLAITVFACYAPARRATKVDPMTALRYE